MRFALPYKQDPDPHLITQVHVYRESPGDSGAILESSIYPHLLGRVALLFPDPSVETEEVQGWPLERHLEAASALHVQMRAMVGAVSALAVPATYAIARAFMEPGWSLCAAALTAASLLGLEIGLMARPHAAAAALVSLALAACLRLRRRGGASSFALAGLAAAAAVGCLQNALAVLFAGLAAFLLRKGARRRWLDPRILIPIGFLALSAWWFYPFAFMRAEAEGSTLQLGTQKLWLDDFNGKGLEIVALTLWYYEPFTLVLAGLGIAAWLARLRRPADAERRKDLAVLLAYALPYAAVIALFDKTMQRFVLPLVPLLACAAAWSARGAVLALARRAPEGVARACAFVLALAAIGVPAFAGVRYVWLRTQPITLDLASRWIQANVSPAYERVGLHSVYDLPLARQTENLFRDGTPRSEAFSPWTEHQQRHLGAGSTWSGTRWFLEPIVPPADAARAGADPEAYLRSFDLDYAVLPGPAEAAGFPVLEGLREAAQRLGTSAFRSPRRPRLVRSERRIGLDTDHFLWHALTAEMLGPGVEIYRLPRERRNAPR